MTTLDSPEAIRQRLEADRAALQAEIDATLVENENQEDSYGAKQHPADDATELFQRELNIPLMSNAQDLLHQVEAALRRLDVGTYGSCARCGRPINPERLEALPYAAYCIDCQAIVERGRQGE